MPGGTRAPSPRRSQQSATPSRGPLRRFVWGMEVLRDGTELHLASFGLADAELRLDGADDPAFLALKAEYADVLGGAPPWLPPGARH